MKKIAFLCSLCLLACLSLSAASLTPEQALQRLTGGVATRGAELANLKYVHSIKLSDGEPGLYIFQNSGAQGYAILSADDLAAPLLGYSEKGKFDENSMSPEMKWWLQEYTDQIEYARSIGAKPYQKISTRADKAPISPMISTTWNQNAPYNLQTPMVNSRHCVTGCVATAMAQVMKFWNYPVTGTGVAECTVRDNENKTTTEQMSLNEENFDWANMLDSYEGVNATDEQKAAVAYLMKACGYSTNMKYALNESGTAVLYVARALANNFEYNKNLQYCQRSYYGASDWNDLIYSELEAGRPIVYGGQSTQAGHCFVCDGYDSDGYFHFNWGWGGMSDGYFLLDALNPGSLGIGANGGGYNFGQNIVIGIQPTEGKQYPPNFIQQGNLQASVSGIQCTLSAGETGGWFNMDTKPISIDLGIKVEPIAPTTGETVYTQIMRNQKLQPSLGWRQITFTMPSSLPKGSYRITLCFRPNGTDEWSPVRCESDYYNYFEFDKESATKFTIHDNVVAIPSVDKVEFLTPLYYGDAVKMSVTVSNPNSKEITNYFYPALYSGENAQMIAEGVVITLAPGESVTKEFICLFELLEGAKEPKVDTEYTLCFYDPSYFGSGNSLKVYEGFSEDVTMKIDDIEMDITVEEFVINEYEKHVQGKAELYYVTDVTYIPFSIKILNNADFFAKPVDLLIFPYVYGQEVYNVGYDNFSPFALLTKGESATLGVNVNFAAGEIGKLYFAMPYIDGVMFEDSQILFKLVDPETVAVDEIENEDLTISYDKASSSLKISGEFVSLVLSSMDGTLFDKTKEASSGSVDLSELPSGIYIVRASSSDGSAKTLKIMK